MRKYLPAILANVSAALSEILLMAAAAWVIASAALQPPLSSLSIGITLVRAAGILRAVLRYVDRFLTHKIIFKVLDELREKLFKRAAAKVALREGEALHKLTITADLLKDFLPRVVLPISTAAILTIFLLALIPFPLSLILLAIFFIALIPKKFAEVDDSDYRGKILDFNDARDELKIYGTAPAIDRLNKAAKSFGDAQMKIQAQKINHDTLINILAAAGICAILFQLCATVDKIELTVWALILIASLEIYSAVPSAARSYKKIPALDEKINFAQEFKTDFAVEFRGVDFGYDTPIFKNFNLQIGCGEHWAITGESGAGKTTLLYLMTKILEPNSGDVAVNGKIAAATATNYIFAESIRANFKIYASEENISYALKICQLEDFDADKFIGEDGANLSGGERVRLQIALALAKNPDILILDEPTAGLDKNCAEKLIAAIVADCTQKNRTLIIITHDLNIASKFENIVNLQSE